MRLIRMVADLPEAGASTSLKTLLAAGLLEIKRAAQEGFKALLETLEGPDSSLSSSSSSGGGGGGGGLEVGEDVLMSFAGLLFDVGRAATLTNEFGMMNLVWTRLGKEVLRFRAIRQPSLEVQQHLQQQTGDGTSCVGWLQRMLVPLEEGSDRPISLVG